jgi:hypothetical protein
MRKLTSALGVTALAALPLGLAVPSALADNPHTVFASCSQAFGLDSHGPGLPSRSTTVRSRSVVTASMP